MFSIECFQHYYFYFKNKKIINLKQKKFNNNLKYNIFKKINYIKNKIMTSKDLEIDDILKSISDEIERNKLNKRYGTSIDESM
jgi:hypothetical protein